MGGWHHQCNGHELEQTLGDCEGQGGLVCYRPWSHKESDTTERLDSIHWSSQISRFALFAWARIIGMMVRGWIYRVVKANLSAKVTFLAEI